MANLRFGTDEEITCIADLTWRGPKNAPLCLGYKTSTHYVGAGLYVSNDGYVISVKDTKDYYALDDASIRAHQAVGELPSPMPAYSLSWGTYAVGYSLWLCILFAIVFEVLRRFVLSRKSAHMEAVRASTPVSFGPPALRTKGDHFVAAQIMPLLRPGEQVQHQAYGVVPTTNGSSMTEMLSFFAVLTSQRLFLITSRVGAFGVLLENRGVEWFERSAIVNVVESGDELTFVLAGGATRSLHVKATKALSNQREFLRDVPRLLVAPPAAPQTQAANPFAA